MSGPIKPDEVVALKQVTAIPDEVFDVFNELIEKRWRGNWAIFTQDEVVARILKKFPRSKRVTEDSIFDNHWLDVSPLYRAVGWKVTRDVELGTQTPYFTFMRAE